MSEKEKQIAERISTFPPELREKFLNQVAGAAMALDAMGVPRPGEKGGQHESGEAGLPRHDCGT